MLGDTFQVAILDEFFDAFARLPRQIQKKVTKFLRAFRENPTSSGINYEKIANFEDPKLRSARIDQAYRAIVVKPDKGNVYLLLWVDHHDEAYAWARHKRVEINPETGSLQVLTSVKVEVEVPEAAAGPEPLFAGLRDRELARLGVPADRIDDVRALIAADQIETLQAVLPPEAYEALVYLADGESLDEVERAMASVPESVDPEDFAAALERDTTRRRFMVVEHDEALEAMLDAPLERWRVFLHPSQRRLVEQRWSGPARVLGTAGTGKTVVALHRAAWLARTYPERRILFTTFTKNLAADLRSQLERLCSSEELRRIDVMHLDAFVQGLLKRSGYGYRIVYGGPQRDQAWDRAMALAPGEFDATFYRDEWELVVQAHGCESWEDYRGSSRSGRGVRLGRRQRKAIWPVFAEYRNRLEAARLREPEDAMRDAAALLHKGRIRTPYQSVLVDEAQDMSTSAFELLRVAIPAANDDLFIVGDGHQRIYRRRVVLSRAGVEVRGRSRRLRVNYRTTEEIRRFAEAVLRGVDIDDLDGGRDDSRGTRSVTTGVEPEIRTFSSVEAEVQGILEWLGEGGGACLVARTGALVDRYARLLDAAGVETRRIRRSEADDPRAKGLRLATMHRVKGLEFDRVVLAGADAGSIPRASRSKDAAVREESMEKERSLVYVALTRARRAALVTAPGPLTDWLRDEPADERVAVDLDAEKTCPRCGGSGKVGEMFGTRRMRSSRKDGSAVVVVRAQSYCSSCRR